MQKGQTKPNSFMCIKDLPIAIDCLKTASLGGKKCFRFFRKLCC